MRALNGAILAVLLTAGPALAAERMISFDPVSPDAKRLTGAGITVRFTDRLLGRLDGKRKAFACPTKVPKG